LNEPKIEMTDWTSDKRKRLHQNLLMSGNERSDFGR
jgi:hypothetical protein